MTNAIVAEGLVKHYGEVTALDGLDLTVEEGTVLGLLGPNGAGQDDVRAHPDHPARARRRARDGGRARRRQAGQAAAPGRSGSRASTPRSTSTSPGFENLDMVGRLYHLGRAAAATRARELLERFDLVEAADRPAKSYSGGMRRRLDLAAALVAEPPVLFLDEPTTGLDPRSRLGMWDVIADLVRGGTTLLLTTQYLEEADRLADRIAVIDHGTRHRRGHRATSSRPRSAASGSSSRWPTRHRSTPPRACVAPLGIVRAGDRRRTPAG